MKSVSERFTLDEFKNEIRDSFLLADIVDGTNVCVRQRGNSVSFPLEALAALGVRGEMLGKNLDCDRATQARVASLVHFAHPAGTQGCDDFVRTESGSCGNPHFPSWKCLDCTTNVRSSGVVPGVTQV